MGDFFWHNLAGAEALRLLRADASKGLGNNEVEIRQKEFGKNKLPEEKAAAGFKIFSEQFKNPLVYILLAAGFVTLVLNELTDTLVIWGALFLNAVFGFLQENKASQTLRALKRVVEHEALVQREGHLKIINAIDLVPGDIIILNPGVKVPADARILESADLKINESALTGEWQASEKSPEILDQKVPLADRDNMVFMGTIVEDGKGKAVVTETGENSQLGKIARTLKEIREEKTPYQKKITSFSKVVGIVIGLICFGIFIEGIVRGGELVEAFTTAVAVAVAAIPEGLPVAMTMILALGMQRILKKKGLVRKLASAETLGSASIVCTDKTATLTEGKMRVEEIIPIKEDKLSCLRAAVFTSEAFVENPEDLKEKWILRGRPTEKALLEAGIRFGVGEYEKQRLSGIPFDPIRKFSAVALKESNRIFLYVSGAPEKIIKFSNLSQGEKIDWENKLNQLAGKGLRIIATAQKEISDSERLEKEMVDLNFLGFIALKDPVRLEVKEAIRTCRQAGMKPIIVTGDHKLTAKAVAEELGFKIGNENILEGKDLDELSDEAFGKILSKIEIYSRVEPRHKLRIIVAWQKKGEVVAMTGDGINDAPALKQADIGIALGSGQEVAKEASDLILLNDSFSILVAAVEEGRGILDNARKVITYLLSDSFTEVILISVSLVFGLPLPILAAQILWVNLIEDGPLSLALAFEPKEKDVIKQKPQNHNHPLLTKEMKVLIFIIGFITDLLLLGLFIWLWRYSDYGISHIRSIIFAGLAVDSMFYIFSCRSLRKNLWQINPFSNKYLILFWLMGVLMLLAALYLPFLQTILRTEPLVWFDWQLILGLGFSNIILIEATKRIFIKKLKHA
ncbi:MAG: HAD-IC family P-type ATPase [bacterium]|nr:HAD-IC family P-type ATPase [bacterium]